jgi:hypothetical protein
MIFGQKNLTPRGLPKGIFYNVAPPYFLYCITCRLGGCFLDNNLGHVLKQVIRITTANVPLTGMEKLAAHFRAARS